MSNSNEDDSTEPVAVQGDNTTQQQGRPEIVDWGGDEIVRNGISERSVNFKHRRS